MSRIDGSRRIGLVAPYFPPQIGGANIYCYELAKALAGKGHENYQVLKDRTIPFDDRNVAREVLIGYGYRRAGGA